MGSLTEVRVDKYNSRYSTLEDAQALNGKLQEIYNMDDESLAKKYLLIALCMTGSSISDEVCAKMKWKQKDEKYFESFRIERTIEDNFYLKKIFEHDTIDISNIDEIDLIELMKVVVNAMKSHSNATTFNRMGELYGDVVKDVLDTFINSLEQNLLKYEQTQAQNDSKRLISTNDIGQRTSKAQKDSSSKGKVTSTFAIWKKKFLEIIQGKG